MNTSSQSDSFPAPICVWCDHLLYDFGCTAFPGGIPEDIMSSTFDHRKEHKDDNGIRFAVKDGFEADAASALKDYFG